MPDDVEDVPDVSVDWLWPLAPAVLAPAVVEERSCCPLVPMPLALPGFIPSLASPLVL
jgi:hypothetical protein